MPVWELTLRLLAAAALLQLGLWALARLLGQRLGWRAMVLTHGLAWLLVGPWLVTGTLLLPLGPVADQLGVSAPASRAHDLLNDAVLQLVPWELEVRHALADGRLPLWSDLLDGGSSPWSNPQAGALSAVALLARLAPIQHHLLAALLLKLVVGGQGTWLLARALGASRAAAALAAACLAWSGALVAWALFPLTTAVAFVPWLTLATLRVLRHPRPRHVAAAAVVTALILLAGHPEVALVGGVFAAGTGLAWSRRRTVRRGLPAAALAALLGLGLAAPGMLPFAHAALASSRAAERELERAAPRPPMPTWREAFLYRGYRVVKAPLSPRAFGWPYSAPSQLEWVLFGSLYAGLLGLAGAALAAATGDRRSWPLLAVVALGLVLGAHPVPLIETLRIVPVLGWVELGRAVVLVPLALALAAALGLDAVRRLSGRRLAVVAGATAAASLAAAPHPAVAGLWVLLGAGLVAARARRPRLALPLLAATVVLDLLPWGWAHLPRSDASLFYPANPLVRAVAAEASAGGPWRAVGTAYELYPALLPVFGVAEVRTHNPLAPQGYLATLAAAFAFAPGLQRYFSGFEHPDHPFLDFLNVRVVVSNVNQAEPATLRRIDRGEHGLRRLFRNPDALPRWFLPAGAQAVAPAELPAWIAGLADPTVVALDAAAVGGWRPAPPAPGAAVTLVRARPGAIDLAADLAGGDGPTLLATSLPGPAGWSARSGGRRLSTVAVNGAFLGVVLPGGGTGAAVPVEVRFTPPGLVAGTAAAAGAALLLALLPLGWRALPAPRRSVR